MFSVIIPCYNAEKYVERCLDSFMKQADGSFEVIIVNDGSTDQSRRLINRKIAGVDNFYLYEQANEGVSSARNTGMDHAHGEYITFADADDYVSDDYAKILNRLIRENPDADVIQYETRGHDYRSCVWSKLVRKELLDRWDIRFGMNCVLGQDMGFSQKLRLATDKIVFAETHVYHYAINAGSASANVDKRFLIYRSIDDLLAFAERIGVRSKENANLKRVIYNHGVLYPLLFLKQHHITGKEYRKYQKMVFKKMEEYADYMPTMNKKTTMARVYALWLKETAAAAVRRP